MPPPVNPPPINEPGAISNPRQLNRWLDVNPVFPLRRTETYITLPMFEYTSDWKGYSEIVAAYNYTSTNNFSLMAYEPPANPNYVACIMWVDEDLNVYRYKLWEDVGEVMWFNAPLYDGELIKKNFRIEIWSTPTEIDVSTITVTGAGTSAANGSKTQVTSQIWGDLFSYNVTSSLTAYTGTGRVNNVLVSLYETDGNGIFGLWSVTGGDAPAPIVTANVVSSQSTALTFYTTMRGGYDYMWQNDAALASASTAITDFAWPLVDDAFPLPFEWPADSVPATNPT